MVELRVPPPPSTLLPYSANVKLTARLSALAVRKIQCDCLLGKMDQTVKATYCSTLLKKSHNEGMYRHYEGMYFRGVRDVVFCESFLSYVSRHPLLQRAVLSSLHKALLPSVPSPSRLSFPSWTCLAYWQARPQHALSLAFLLATLLLGCLIR